MSPSAVASTSRAIGGAGFTREALEAMAASSGGASSLEDRIAAFERYRSLAAAGAKPGPYWKIDLNLLDFNGYHAYRRPEKLAPGDLPPEWALLAADDRAGLFLQHDSESVFVGIGSEAARAGVVVTDLAQAKETHAELFAATFNSIVLKGESKFVALTNAFQSGGAFVYVPPNVRLDQPIVISYVVDGAALFPHTLIIAAEGAEVTLIENIIAARGESGHPVVGITEVHAQERAKVTYAALQTLGPAATHIVTRRAKPEADAHVTWVVGELGGKLSYTSVDGRLAAPGAQMSTYGLFFAANAQHVDLTANVDHAVGATQSFTHIKGAARSAGQARFRGNIRIDAGAHGAESALREDALLLSGDAHIDSIPGLEIAANDVKAFHGATVGALDEEELFYVTARGIPREDAEKLITLGFFEPVLEHFPCEPIRERIRRSLAASIV